MYEGDKLLAEYEYNSFGERIKKVVYADSGKRVTYFLYEGHQLSAEIDATDKTPTREQYQQTIYLGHAPVAYLRGTETYVVQSDHLGTPHRVTDSNNQTVWSADYSPYGETTITTEQISFKHRFPGQYFDAETATHYNYFRDYDPATGRYLTSDPIGLKAGPNIYNYVSSNPIIAFDPLGLSQNLAVRAGFFGILAATSGQLAAWATAAAATVTTGATAVFAFVTAPATLVALGAAAAGVSIYLLAEHYFDQYQNSEVEFTEQIGQQPSPDQLDSINELILSFDPAFDHSTNEYDGYHSIFNAVLQLEQAQRDYINNYTSTYNSNHPDCQAGSQAADLYLQAVLDTAFADASGTNQEDSPTTSGRLEFPIVDTEATILVTPGESEAEVYIEGFPAGIDITVRPGENGGYIFVPADDDAAALLHGIPGFPIEPEDQISIGLVLNASGDAVPRVLQTSGNTINNHTANVLNHQLGVNLHRREWGRMLEEMKQDSFLSNDHHGKIWDNGDYTDEDGNLIGNLLDYLP